jgi:hypothetical protein
MSDFIDAIAAHLDREPSMCACGHPSVLHAARVGCVAVPWGEGPPCECYDAEGRPPCRCGHFLAEHTDRVGCTARWEHDSGSDVCPCEETP